MKFHLALLALAATACAQVDVNPGGVLAVGENAPVVLNPAELVALATAERKRRQEAAASPAASPVAAVPLPAPAASPVAAGAHGDGDGDGEGYEYPPATPPVNPEWPLPAAGSVMVGMSIIGVLVLAGASGIMGYLWMSKKKRGQDVDPNEAALGVSIGESAMHFTEKN